MMVKVLINGHAYQMTKTQAVKTINQIKKTRKGTNTILALEKNKIYEMRDDVYPNAKALLKAVKEYNKQGYVVYKVVKNE